jgi:RHS repeat-associated protein
MTFFDVINTDLGDFRDATNTDDDYEYWLDGSLKKDKNKKISSITYNYLKLPKTITFDNGRTITTEYDASGTKLKKTLSTGKVFDYEEDEIYEDGVLYQTSHDEGRIVNDIYEYNITDHLGNVRVSFKDSAGVAKITQVNHVGAWGEPLTGINSVNTPKINNFTLSTYEKENDFGIGVFDAHARVFDPVTPRFWSIDPLSELSRRFSPYVFSNNNPLMFIDPDGMRAVWNGKFGSESGYNDDETGESVSWGQVQSEYGLGGGDGGKKDKNGNTHFNGGYKDKDGNSHYYPSMDVTMTMTDGGRETYNRAALKETALAIMPWGRIFRGLGLGKLGSFLLGKFVSRAEPIVAYGISGEGYTAKYLASLFESTENTAMKTLYRGMTGSEGGNGALFLSEDAAYAATYAKNGLGVAEIKIPQYAYYVLKNENLFQPFTGINSVGRAMGSEISISNPVVKELILKSIIK